MPTRTRTSLIPEKTTVAPDPTPPRRDLFGTIAAWTTRFTGGRWGFVLAFGTVIVWALSGPFFGFSDQWQLVINTGTTVVTFLMVFLIQNAQNRESKAFHLKLDELILSTRRARNELIDIETLTDDQLDRLAERYRSVSRQCRENLEKDDFLNPVRDEPPGVHPSNHSQRTASQKGG